MADTRSDYCWADMKERYIFHLSIPVSELTSAKRFYVEVLGATVGRENEEWLDILLWGHQITLQHRPEEVLPLAKQGKRHFGVVLPWTEWEREAARIERLGVGVLESPSIKLAGTDDEQGKFYLHDPSGNVIELKAYRNVERTLYGRT
jgi:extradiol dioxygenase family protein